MKCPKCGRNAGLIRRKCPACKIQLARWYVLIVLLALVVGFGGLALIGKLPWHT